MIRPAWRPASGLAMTLGCLAAGPPAQPPSGGPPPSATIRLLARDDVARELKLTPDQTKDLADLAEIVRFAGRQPGRPGPKPPEGSASPAPGAVPGAEGLALFGILSGDQARRFEQVRLQELGPRGLLDEKAAALLKLTKSQRDDLSRRVAELEASRPPSLGGTARKAAEADDSMLDVLTPPQLQRWKRMLGAPFRPASR